MRKGNERARLVVLATGRLQTVLMIVLALAYLGMLYVGPDIILPSQGNDARSVEVLSTSVDEVNSFDGYAAMAAIYASTTFEIRYLLLILIALIYFWVWVQNARTVMGSGVIVFLSIAPILLFLCFFVKDTMYLPFMVAAYLVLQKIRNNVIAVILAGLIYALYAYIFRSYFLLVAGLFLALVIFRRSPGQFRIVFAIAVLVVLYFLPDELYRYLHDARDAVNRHRIGFSGAGYRTLFMNLVPPDGLFNFLINYGYSVVRLNVPIIFEPGMKEAFLTVNTCILGYLCVIGLSSNDRRVWRPTLLFIAHFLVLMIFEPDYGSYLRHIMTSAPLLAPALGTATFGRKDLAPDRSAPPRRRLANRDSAFAPQS